MLCTSSLFYCSFVKDRCPLSATACILYHVLPPLSRGFSKVFSTFFHAVRLLRGISLPLFATARIFYHLSHDLSSFFDGDNYRIFYHKEDIDRSFYTYSDFHTQILYPASCKCVKTGSDCLITIFVRTVLIYLLLLVTMRLMGKRQLGELEISDLITTFMLSEIAALPITNQDIPLSFAIIPILTLMCLEVFLSAALLHIPICKRLLSTKPVLLVYKGKIQRTELRKTRISMEELLSELRQQSIVDPGQVEYAILEQNGKISVIAKAAFRQPTISEAGLTAVESGISHLLISDGKINKVNLSRYGKDEAWLEEQLSQNHIRLEDTFYFLIDDAGTVRVESKQTQANQKGAE